MMRKDFIVRQFEEFGKVLSALLMNKRNGDWEKFNEQIRQAAEDFTSQNMDELAEMSDEDFAAKMNNSGMREPEKKKILASLLFEQMEYYAAMALKEKEKAMAGKCYYLYTALLQDLTQNEFDLEAHYRCNFLRECYGF